MSDNPSGVRGPLGWVADAWDRLPVRGVVLALTVAGGAAASFAHGGTSRGECERTPLVHVYHPQRLRVLETCADVTGAVVAWRREHDGDYHVNMRIDAPGWTNAVNDSRQHGLTVVEFVPLMPQPARFYAGQRLRIVGTKVADQQHKPRGAGLGWVEMHPVFRVEDVTPASVSPKPNRLSLAPASEEEER